MRRIALCMSGGMRCYRQTVDSLRRNLIEANPDCEFDLFLVTNEKVSHGSKDYQQPDAYGKRVSELYGPLMKRKEKPFSEAAAQEVYGDLLRRMEVWGDDQPYGYFQILSMFWKIVRCDEIRMEYGREHDFEYDLVIRLRSDLLICTPLDLTPFFDKPGVMFQSWLYNPGEPRLVEPLMTLLEDESQPLAPLMPHPDAGGKFSDIMFWSDGPTMARMHGVTDFFLKFLNRFQKDKGLPPLTSHTPPPEYGGHPGSWDMLTLFYLRFKGITPHPGRTFLSFLVLHLVLEQGVTIRKEDLPEEFRRELLRAYFRDEPFTARLALP
ncbi:hypothetical protein GM415_04920 [Pseudodesulfovibrio cashew]|uniref:Uncharacterized protein n=1 Tax=Pseudodesulfovibrio cashew TaxID=2678688 RepID=A0A6I6JEK2_9BACT|nr:hypothetical protein [Pseudodesulfovibrio cashew]QGY39490.1 hypothetical protein GM415_04920 [Pseudodesulfovibrio cashew]